LAQQPGGELTSAVPKTRTGDGEVQGREDPSEVCRRHASIHNHFNQDRHLNRRYIFKQMRSAALAEWRQLAT
jgi:putative transposase